jgi:hypothetical protein
LFFSRSKFTSESGSPRAGKNALSNGIVSALACARASAFEISIYFTRIFFRFNFIAA